MTYRNPIVGVAFPGRRQFDSPGRTILRIRDDRDDYSQIMNNAATKSKATKFTAVVPKLVQRTTHNRGAPGYSSPGSPIFQRFGGIDEIRSLLTLDSCNGNN
jgi:hypothetical protein